MAHGAAADVRLGEGAHLDRAQDAGAEPAALEEILQRERVDHGREHAHRVGGGPVHPVGAGRGAADDVSAADDDPQLRSALKPLLDLPGQAPERGGVDSLPLIPGQDLTAQLQEEAAPGRGHGVNSLRCGTWRSGER